MIEYWMEFINNNITILAGLCAGLCVTFSTFVVVDFIGFTSSRYRERYLEEASVEMDEVLLQIPASRILDLSLALSALAIFVSIGLLAFFTDTLTLGKCLFVSILAAAMAFPAPRLYLRFLRKQRLAKFNEQLEDALLSMSGSLKAGFSIIQALDVVANENRNPISLEFTLLMQEIRLGVPLEQALMKMHERVGSPDFELVAVAIITARQTGGELTVILERLAGVIRERVRITQRITSLTAQGRLQAKVIGAMPFLLMFAMSMIAPAMMNMFFGSIQGVLLILLAVTLVIIGFFIIRKITTIDI